MTPQQMAESGTSQLQKAVLEILQEAPERWLETDDIRIKLKIPLSNYDGLNGHRRLIEGIVTKLGIEGLVQVDRAPNGNRCWKLKQ